jgi:SAM-dependent methyltransferase
VTVDIKSISDALRKYPAVHSAAWRAYRTSHMPLALARRPYQIKQYLGSPGDFAGLQIGAGPHGLRGWLKTDLDPNFSTVYLNATKRFPFADETFDYVVAEHMIEHVPYEGALAMLRECRRVLKKGGAVRISTPDIQLTHRLMQRPLTPELERYVLWSNERYGCAGDPGSAVQVVNRLQHEWGHTFLYDAETLADALRRAGFTETTQCTPGVSAHPALENIDSHAQVIGEEFNELESLIIEAVK